MISLEEIDKIVDKATTILSEILSKNEIDDGHGLEHAVIVLNHTKKAIECSPSNIDNTLRLELLLSALLHDADDRKFFPESKDLDNARIVLNSTIPGYPESINNIVNIINMVSFSKNGNTYFNDKSTSEILLYPCLADRCEAIGKIGFERSYIYSVYRNRPVFNDNTPRCKTLEELYQVVSNERLAKYLEIKESETTIDHFYDKVFHLTRIEIHNPYFKEIFETRTVEMENIILYFGRTGKILDDIAKII